MTTTKLPTDVYWITLPPEDLGPAVAERFRKYHDELDQMGRLAQYKLARRRYEGGHHSGTSSSTGVTHGGEQGESSELTVNHYGSLITAVHAMVTQNRPAFSASAQDDSADSLAAVQLVDQLLEYELGRGAEEEYVDAVRRFLILQEAGLGVFWHPEAGDVIGVEPIVDPAEMFPGADQQPQPKEIKAGELRTEAFSPYDVARDLGARSLDAITWQIVRRRANKWDLAAIYPDHEGEIQSAKSVDLVDLERALTTSSGRSNSMSDTIYVLELYALPSPAVPNGRYARVCETTTLETGDLMYKRLPVGLHAPERSIDRAQGNARTIDLLALQEAYDGVMSNLLSNNDAFGRGNVITADGQDMGVEDLAGGLNRVTYTPVDGAEEPHAMLLPRLSPEDMRLASDLREDMQRLKAISNVSRGGTDDSVKSGAHAALIEASAAKHNNNEQWAGSTMLRGWANRVVETYRVFATSKRVIEVTGSDEVRTAESFVGTDLNAIVSVNIEIANPYMRTIAGKKELADFYADPARWGDATLSIEEHMAFMSTGRRPTVMRTARQRALSVRDENEAISRGEPVVALRGDMHEMHIREHNALLDGRVRMKLKPEVIKALDEHIRAHESLWVTLTIQEPHVLMATGQQPAPLPMQPMGAPPGGPPGGGPPQPENDNGMDPLARAAGPDGIPPPAPGMPASAMPTLPSMPTNPSTGKRVPAAGGMQ